MNTINKTTRQDDVRIPVQMKLSALWAALMCLYIYADIISLFRPGQLEEMAAGRMGPFPVTQGSLLTAALLMLVPALMVFLSLALPARAVRWANIVLGLVYTAVNIGNLVGATWAYYLLFGIVELALTLLIAWHAWQWRRSSGQAA